MSKTMRKILITLIILSCLVLPASAAMLINGTLYYNNLTPDNDPLELYVRQGDSLYLGKTYDLSGVTPITYLYAWWKNWKDAGATCKPDKTIDIWYIRTMTDEKAVRLDPEKWEIGDWYYWDPEDCNITSYDRSEHKVVKATGPLQADNKFAFTIIRPPARVFPVIQSIPVFTPGQTYKSAYQQ